MWTNLGTHQHLAVDLEISVAENGGLRLRSTEQRFYEGPVAFRFPLAFSGVAEVCEWWDEAAQCFRIKVDVTNRRWGPLFGYEGAVYGGLESGWDGLRAGGYSPQAGGGSGVERVHEFLVFSFLVLSFSDLRVALLVRVESLAAGVVSECDELTSASHPCLLDTLAQ